jgi:hypothetical protein
LGLKDPQLQYNCFFCTRKLTKIQRESFVSGCESCLKCIERTTENNKNEFEFWALIQREELWEKGIWRLNPNK